MVHALVEYPVLTLFVVIGLGYLVGEINFFGFRFGVAGVLFMGLAVGALHPNVALPEIVSTLGLIIFVYAVGIHSGPAFFAAFRKQGYRDTMFALGLVIFGAVLTLTVSLSLHLGGARTAGLFTGAMTNTPALAAARERAREQARASGASETEVRALGDEPVVAYSIAYPLGVILVLIGFNLARRLWRVEFGPAEEAPEILVRDFVVCNPGVIGQKVEEVLRVHGELGFVVSRIRHNGSTGLVTSETLLADQDIVAVVGDEEALQRARHIFGEPTNTHIEADRSELDFRRVFVSSAAVVGKRIRDLDLANRLHATITRLRRGDADVVATPDTRLWFGDRVRVLTRRENFAAVSGFFGDSIRGTAETDFGSVAIGMVLGALVGMLPIPLPGGAKVSLGFAGGPLLVALVLGAVERTGRISWNIPVSANLTLRQIGLLLFLAGVGTKAGYAFLQTMRTNGLQMLVAGAFVTAFTTLAGLIVGYKVLRIRFDTLMGMVSGVQTQPACLAFATTTANNEAPNVGYASVYPVAMIAKIILVQVLLSWAG
ncbi:MAG TPA: aspartate:alanine exchanger family transporter [Terriglobales bacterium]|nr:aspartate:alanine exchanger family transporter [Terriglobales bacterium]